MRKHGFTLLEIAIVLVVIGLVIGGVLVGRDLIEAAKSRTIISELDRYRTSIYLYKNKYNALPGDDPNAAKYFGDTCGTGFQNTCNGNGNGEVLYAYWQPGEHLRVFEHLSFAGFSSQVYKSTDGNINCMPGACPVSKASPTDTGGRAFTYVFRYIYGDSDSQISGGVYSGQDTPASPGHYFTLYDAAGHGGHPTSGIHPSIALAIDSKMDDGLPGGGNVRGSNGFGWRFDGYEGIFPYEEFLLCRSGEVPTSNYYLGPAALSCLMYFKF